MRMSLVFSTVEVAAGPTVGLTDQVDLPGFLPPGEKKAGEEKLEVVGSGFSFGSPPAAAEEEGVSSESSSIGVESSSSSSSSEEEEDRGSDGQDEAQSKPKDGAFGSLDSLEESLPIKRGLSNFFAGKSKSFASLSECSNASARDLAKPDNPFNKRRRLLMACKSSSWSRRASCSSLIAPLPALLSPAFAVEEGEEEEDERGGGGGESSALAPLPHSGKLERKMIHRAFKSPRSFSLSDLQHA